jgi:hypothetical protein
MKRALAIALVLAACGDDDSAAYVLCDGSDAVRFGIASIGGHVDSTYHFTNPYGHSFIFVTGRCEFAGSTATGVYRSGTLTKAQAETLTRAFDLANVDGKSFRASGGCPDATLFQVMTSNGYVELTCGAEPPSYAHIADDGALQAQQIVDAAGVLVTGAVSVLAVGDFQIKEQPNPGAVPWPFGWPVAEIAVERSNLGGSSSAGHAGRTITGADAERARSLRTTTSRGFVDVRAGERDYALFVRDELEPALAASIARFRSEVDPFAHREVEVCSHEILQVALDEPSVIGKDVNITTTEELPCGARLCWDGEFREEVPVGATLRVEVPSSSRRCEGDTSFTSLHAGLQLLVDGYRQGYPSTPVQIELVVAGAKPVGFPQYVDDLVAESARCSTLSSNACMADPRCSALLGQPVDDARQCLLPTTALGCSAYGVICTEALVNAVGPDGRRAIFGNGCLPRGWRVTVHEGC